MNDLCSDLAWDVEVLVARKLTDCATDDEVGDPLDARASSQGAWDEELQGATANATTHILQLPISPAPAPPTSAIMADMIA